MIQVHLGDAIQPATPGESVVLSLGDGGGGVTVRIVPRTVAPARESTLQKFLYTPRIWASTAASLFVVFLLGTAIATGTVRSAPPPAPSPAPGQPTPTPDSRPIISFGGIQLVPPAPPPRPAATPQPRPTQTGASETADDIQALVVTEPQPADQETSDQTPPTRCTNFLGIGCPRNATPSAPVLVIPVASPEGRSPDGPLDMRAANVPTRGSTLDMALRAASQADQNFAHAMEVGPRPAPDSR